ncbi:MAG: hypothetical protein U1A22_01885 [Xanthomonadaceae bacterium]|nr:hypothetical protein [Xanthomonadaceae bacterium]
MPETEETTAPESATELLAHDPSLSSVMDAIVELIRSGVRPDVLEAQRILLQRLANQGDVFPARIPPPRNITEIGGYLNLLERAGQLDIRSSAMASALGVAGPAPAGEALAGAVPIGFVTLANDRPPSPAQASIPPLLTVRADFHAPLQIALAQLHASGCQLPLRAPRPVLPASQPGVGASLDPDLILSALGRLLEVFPGTVLIDPALDPLAIARPEQPATEVMRLVARELDAGTTVTEASWVAQRASATAVATDAAAPYRFLEVAPILADAGWIHPEPLEPPVSRTQRGSLVRFVNLTGLIDGETTLGDELSLLYTPATVARSALAGFIGWIWDGARFSAPA